MKLVITDSRLLKEPITIISELVTEVKLKFDKDKMQLVAMDPANVAMVIFQLLSSSFSEYKVSDEEIAVNLDNFKNILRRAKSSDTLIIESEKNKLKITIKGETTRTFNLAMIDITTADQKIPELDFPIKINTNTLLFNEAIEDMDIVSDSVNFVMKDNVFLINTEGSFSNALVELVPSNETIITSSTNDAKSKYSLEYLKKIIKGSKLTNEVVIQFDKDYPLKIDYIIKDKLSLGFLLAPRVQND
ncbi:MAG: proliferating cell nuclear antigen (pcna) [Nanoarchaeota archaeon]|nr:proliferating cell nuclear antigen (pcna) [Nanoarchaeota archaeon]MBU0962891.1 proliferating cell nuclear antigen (pcna) [Nanoarchaeota archaeon]